ncbi:hypothetical protein SOVF_151110 [Spinacia oleracea]|uniref:DUF569 domain-containing protein n=1 Tax=Spinacia oleracea TaxID=3562 RepID=A0A9R0I8N1_SPIOL|nr:uncharacterized protein LOC110784508 [Spinacia oleracea]KNA09712.1 hypothetical protein SOVF_151110 [Spinacia oleracea]
MDLLIKTGAVKLRSHLEKFLVGDDDNETVRQSRNGSSQRAIWVVELCSDNREAVRFKNLSSGLYLTASDSQFLLGMTGKRVLQLSIFDPTRVEWEPISDGFQLKFRSTKEGKYLRANGGTPPWRNSVTHDSPLTGGTTSWILWDVEPVLLSDLGSFNDALSTLSSFNSVFSDEFGGSNPGSPMSARSIASSPASRLFSKKRSGMDLFYNAKTVRLKSHHDKYLIAEDDKESVTQDRNGSARNARWVVEPVKGSNHIIRLKSCYGKYLTASNQHFLLGMTGSKVLQTMPRKLDSSVEWEPTKDGSQVRLKTRYGNYLRANGGLPPWRNSVTHDVPHRTATQDWVVWNVDILEISDYSDKVDDEVKKVEDLKPKAKPGSGLEQATVEKSDSFGSDMNSVSNGSQKYNRQESSDSGTYSPPKQDGRLIYYHVADDYGGVDDGVEGNSFTFKGHSVKELTQKLEEETGLEDILVCTRSPLNAKLYPLRLQLPPNNTTMHIVVVPSTSRLAGEFAKAGIS